MCCPRHFRDTTLRVADVRVPTDCYHIQYTPVRLTRVVKIPKLFQGLEAFDHGSFLMPNTVETKIEEMSSFCAPMRMAGWLSFASSVRAKVDRSP